jgi:hypothetical protein
MHADHILGQLHAAGLGLRLGADGALLVAPAGLLLPELRDLIRQHKTALVLALAKQTHDANIINTPTEPFTEPPGYEGTGWRLAGAAGLSAPTLARFRDASLALDAAPANHLQLQETTP